jgi:hypothetical protein
MEQPLLERGLGNETMDDEESPSHHPIIMPGNDTAITDSTVSDPGNWKQAISAYVKSKDFVEFLFGLCLVISGVIFEGADIKPHMRPLPVMQLESTGDYIVNQVNNEEFKSESISGM